MYSQKKKEKKEKDLQKEASWADFLDFASKCLARRLLLYVVMSSEISEKFAIPISCLLFAHVFAVSLAERERERERERNLLGTLSIT